MSLQPVDARRPVIVHPRWQVRRHQRQRVSATGRRRLPEDALETQWTGGCDGERDCDKPHAEYRIERRPEVTLRGAAQLRVTCPVE